MMSRMAILQELDTRPQALGFNPVPDAQSPVPCGFIR